MSQASFASLPNIPRQYALSNIFTLVGDDAVLSPRFSSTSAMYRAFLLFHEIIICVISLSVITSLVFRRLEAARKLSELDRVQITLHVLFFVFFTAQLIPWSMQAYELLFSPTGVGLLDNQYTETVLFLSFLSKSVLYVIEGSIRSIVRFSWFLVLHHLLFAAFVVIAFGTRSVFAAKVDIILDLFAAYEFLLYAGLVARRLHVNYFVTQLFLVVGIVVYGATRLIQAFLLTYLFAGSYGRLHSKALWWILLFGCITLIVLQTITFPIYWGIIKRTKRKQEKMELRASMRDAEAANAAVAEAHRDLQANGHAYNSPPTLPSGQVQLEPVLEDASSDDEFDGGDRFLPSLETMELLKRTWEGSTGGNTSWHKAASMPAQLRKTHDF